MPELHITIYRSTKTGSLFTSGVYDSAEEAQTAGANNSDAAYTFVGVVSGVPVIAPKDAKI